MYNRKRNVRIEFRVTDEEREQIAQRMAQAGAVNANAYLRKMAIDGMIIQLDLPELKELVSLLRRCSNNINQLAAKANTLGFVDAPQLKKEAERWHKFQADVERTFLRPDKSDMKWQ